MDKQGLEEWLDRKTKEFTAVSDLVWGYAETRFEEVQSAKLLADCLEQAGFTVERGTAGLATAFQASFGQGKPVIALLGEYDALSGLSQQGDVAEKKPITPGDSGHGCGHNLLGVGALAAAMAVKEYLAANHVSGTVRFYGCPGEEGGSGKAFMAREGVFDDVDAALTWHPHGHNAVYSVRTLANYQVYFRFHGKSAHAGAAPHLGRSALDAVELMNVGVNYLREHVIPEARLHYAVTNTGGSAPNVVQAEAEVLYLIRAPKLKQVQEIYDRVCNVAKGAALMTGTDCEIVFNKGCSDCLPNDTLEKLLYENYLTVGAPQWSEAELTLARKIQATLADSDKENDWNVAKAIMGNQDKALLAELKQVPLAHKILPYQHDSMLLTGSTDVGDVSWITPTAQISAACQAFGTPGHSWQTVSQGVTSIAHKGMLTAAKVLAKTAVDLFLAPDLLATAKQELIEKRDGEDYKCPIPAGIKPSPAK
ncbi:MAG: M20 family metallopeptidase [Sporomusaceae bacterium]|nr:M20 family metallopeptidase [Sporomusaceae bacterium]